jgi:hypothetical protein
MRLLQPLIVLVLYALVRAGDIAIAAAIARDTVRAVIYGIVAILALIVLIIALLGLS